MIVKLSKRAKKDIEKLPIFIIDRLLRWIESIDVKGLQATRKLPGLHDEPLKGDRMGQRSIRLNDAYRAIYRQTSDGKTEILEVIEVNKHKY